MDDEDAQVRSGNTTPDAADAGRGGRNPSAEGDGAESITATAGRTKAEVATQLMEQVVERGNMWKAYPMIMTTARSLALAAPEGPAANGPAEPDPPLP